MVLLWSRTGAEGSAPAGRKGPLCELCSRMPHFGGRAPLTSQPPAPSPRLWGLEILHAARSSMPGGVYC